jgi:hypothetical protein
VRQHSRTGVRPEVGSRRPQLSAVVER